MSEVEGIANGLKGSGGGAERIFVGSKFCDLGWVESVFAGDIGDGPTRLVGVEVGDVGVGLGTHGFWGTDWVWRERKRWRARRIFG